MYQIHKWSQINNEALVHAYHTKKDLVQSDSTKLARTRVHGLAP
jgi:hypothetical protein